MFDWGSSGLMGKFDEISPQIEGWDYSAYKFIGVQSKEQIMAGSIWKGSISFGLLNIPVSLHKAQEEKQLHFSMLDGKDLSPIKYKKVSGKDNKEVPWNRIVKGYEYESGQYVILNKEDFKAANPKATQTIDIEDFVQLSEIDFMFLEKPYYLIPQKDGIKGYFLLAEALMKTKKVAIAKIVMRTKQHLVAIMARDHYLILEILRFPHEVILSDEVDSLVALKKPKFNVKEIKMAEELINGMTGKWKPEQYQDTYYDDIMKIVNLKIKAGEGKEIEYEKPPKEPKGNTGMVVDLMPLLKKSLEEKKKVTKTGAPRRGKRKVVGKKAA